MQYLTVSLPWQPAVRRIAEARRRADVDLSDQVGGDRGRNGVMVAMTPGLRPGLAPRCYVSLRVRVRLHLSAVIRGLTRYATLVSDPPSSPAVQVCIRQRSR